MLTLLLSPIISIFQYTLQPVAPFTWFGLGISTLDLVAAFRLAFVLRQLREQSYKAHVSANGVKDVERPSFVKNVTTTLTVVYGGEAVTAPLLGLPASFMVSGAVPGIYTAIQAIVDALPEVPAPSASIELPLSIVDGFTRSLLLCNIIPPVITNHPSSMVADSPWTLLVSALAIANGGFFMTNMFSLLSPTSYALRTPPELQEYGWTTADLWCAPMITGLYALLTHSQPFWADLHVTIVELLGGATTAGFKASGAEALDPEVARAVCALLLSSLFLGRTVKNFGLWKPAGNRFGNGKAKAD